MAKKRPVCEVATINCSTKEPSPKKPLIPPVTVGQVVFVSVIVKEIWGERTDCSPRLFSTREAAQADCDELNKTRMTRPFTVREMRIES